MVTPGDRVRLRSSGASGTVAYYGPLEGKKGVFVGVELDRAAGKNDGSFQGEQYFSCLPGHGVFSREDNLTIQFNSTKTRGGRPESRSSTSSSSSDTSRRSDRLQNPQQRMARRHSAARSHEQNEAYMEDFHNGLKQLSKGQDALEQAGFDQKVGEFSFPWDKGDFSKAFQVEFQSRGDWGRGPSDPSGILMDASDQPLLCSALSPDAREVVVGGCDHGLKVYDTTSGKQKRQLFSKEFGHHEWVTGVTYCPDGSILSSGMDSKLCLWRGATCVDLEGHRGSVSRTFVTEQGRYAMSCSYDKTVRFWDLQTKRQAGCFTGHKAPIMEMAFNDGVLLTGARDGMALAWDLVTGKPHRLNEGQHKGQISSLATFGPAQFASGDQAGFVRVWDLRVRGSQAAKACLHPGGAVSEIVATDDATLLVTAGADRKIVLSDPRRLTEPLDVIEHHKDFIYSLAITSDHILSGAGDGVLLVHELATSKLCYGLGANAAGVRSIQCADSFFVASGDDGKAILYNFY